MELVFFSGELILHIKAIYGHDFVWLRMVGIESTATYVAYQAHPISWTNAGLMLVHRLRRWSNFKPALDHFFVSVR